MAEGAKCDLTNRETSYLIRYMQKVGDYSRILNALGDRWEMLTLLGQMSGTGTDMSKTKDGFATLSSKLLDNLAKETIKKLSSEINSKASVAVDILIRNLFERTADIGFLATDNDIRTVLAPPVCEPHMNTRRYAAGTDCDEMTREKNAIKARFREYVEKYSVYFDIVLFNTNGDMIVRLDDRCDVKRTTHRLLEESIQTSSEYVETLDKIDFLPDFEQSLVYSYRVCSENEPSEALGVLCLCFKFEDEMERIFSKLQEGNEWLALCILDTTGRIIASSDKYQLPIGAKIDMAINEDYKITKFAGRNYIATTCATKGYQGYFGLGWYGHAMIALEHAFDLQDSDSLHGVNESVLSAVMSNPTLFSNDLREIPLQAELIQKELERTVWNGNVRQSSSKKAQSASFSKALLWEISATGAKTKAVFESSIGNLHETVVSSILSDASFQATLAIDIMDRNLYERANDCRWWALTSIFREILSKDVIEKEDMVKISSILSYINALYTVYTNLFIFDKNGKILALSKHSDEHFVGKVLNDEYIKQVLQNSDTSVYSVSSFVKSPLYNGVETYIYGASILSPDFSEVVGGIGVVFDSTPQFEAMLLDALPKDEKGDVLDNCFGVFADKNKNIISSTNKKYQTGARLNIDDEFFKLQNGIGFANIILFDGSYFAVGSRCSGGYREYKSDNDSYKNDVVAIVFIYLGQHSESLNIQQKKRDKSTSVSHNLEHEEFIEIATFFIDDKWLGVRAENILEAISVKGLTAVPGANKMLLGRTNYNGRTIDVITLRGELGLNHKDVHEDDQIVIVRLEHIENMPKQYGILVNELGEIPEVPLHRVDKLDSIVGGTELLGDMIVKPEVGQIDREMLVVIDPSKVIYKLVKKA